MCIYFTFAPGQCQELVISDQHLGSEETQALVQAMESGVEEVELRGEVTLDIRSLMEYSGQGKCSKLGCCDDTVPRYREQLMSWASSNNWTVMIDYSDHFVIHS